MTPKSNHEKKRQMPGVHVRLPSVTYKELAKLARKQSRTITAQATFLLEAAVLQELLRASK